MGSGSQEVRLSGSNCLLHWGQPTCKPLYLVPASYTELILLSSPHPPPPPLHVGPPIMPKLLTQSMILIQTATHRLLLSLQIKKLLRA